MYEVTQGVQESLAKLNKRLRIGWYSSSIALQISQVFGLVQVASAQVVQAHGIVADHKVQVILIRQCRNGKAALQLFRHKTQTVKGQFPAAVVASASSFSAAAPADAVDAMESFDSARVLACTETGLTAGSRCSVCDEVLVAQKVVPATGHSYVDSVCETCGDKMVTMISAPEVRVTNVSSTGKIKLTWNEVAGAASYDIYRATSKTGTYSQLKNATNTSAVAGTTCSYKVIAVHTKSSANSAYTLVDSIKSE